MGAYKPDISLDVVSNIGARHALLTGITLSPDAILNYEAVTGMYPANARVYLANASTPSMLVTATVSELDRVTGG